MSTKTARITRLLQGLDCPGVEPHYAGYFACFNRRLFFEAHEVLEALWLPARHSAEGDFYKGLIQLAGAFVHLQKNRLQPAAALLRLADANLAKYPSPHRRLDVTALRRCIHQWQERLRAAGGGAVNPYSDDHAPQLRLLDG